MNTSKKLKALLLAGALCIGIPAHASRFKKCTAIASILGVVAYGGYKLYKFELNGRLREAVYNDDINKTRWLLRLGADPNYIGWSWDVDTPLHLAIRDSHIDLIRLLIEKGANVNAKNRLGTTPLNRAVKRNEKNLIRRSVERGAVARLLIEHGANVNAPDNAGLTPLYSADTDEMFQLLVEHGANINTFSKENRTFFHVAAIRGMYKAARWLIEQGVDVNAQNNHGWTALHYAVVNRNHDVMELLLKSGADIDIKTVVGKTALDYAYAWKNKEAIQAIQERRAAQLIRTLGPMANKKNTLWYQLPREIVCEIVEHATGVNPMALNVKRKSQ